MTSPGRSRHQQPINRRRRRMSKRNERKRSECWRATRFTSRTPTTVLQLGCCWDPENRVPMYSTATRYLCILGFWLMLPGACDRQRSSASTCSSSSSPSSRADSSPDLQIFEGFGDGEGGSRGLLASSCEAGGVSGRCIVVAARPYAGETELMV